MRPPLLGGALWRHGRRSPSPPGVAVAAGDRFYRTAHCTGSSVNPSQRPAPRGARRQVTSTIFTVHHSRARSQRVPWSSKLGLETAGPLRARPKTMLAPPSLRASIVTIGSTVVVVEPRARRRATPRRKDHFRRVAHSGTRGAPPGRGGWRRRGHAERARYSTGCLARAAMPRCDQAVFERMKTARCRSSSSGVRACRPRLPLRRPQLEYTGMGERASASTPVRGREFRPRIQCFPVGPGGARRSQGGARASAWWSGSRRPPTRRRSRAAGVPIPGAERGTRVATAARPPARAQAPARRFFRAAMVLEDGPLSRSTAVGTGCGRLGRQRPSPRRSPAPPPPPAPRAARRGRPRHRWRARCG